MKRFSRSPRELPTAESVCMDWPIRFHLVKNTNEDLKRLIFVIFQLPQLYMLASPIWNRH